MLLEELWACRMRVRGCYGRCGSGAGSVYTGGTRTAIDNKTTVVFAIDNKTTAGTRRCDNQLFYTTATGNSMSLLTANPT